MMSTVSAETTPPKGGGEEERVYVLYGSQTGNAEQAAKDVCTMVRSEQFAALLRDEDKSNGMTVQPVHMQLDDFLEIERAPWTRLVVIITSSYGVGMAPLGCYRFRELCDAFWDDTATPTTSPSNNNGEKDTTKTTKTNNKKILEGLKFAILGLGDSKFTTYFQNPSKIHKALCRAGAVRVGPFGQVDASGTGPDEQTAAITKWIQQDIGPHLAKALVSSKNDDAPSAERLKEMQRATVEICRRINPDFCNTAAHGAKNTSRLGLASGGSFTAIVMVFAVAVLAVFVRYYYYTIT